MLQWLVMVHESSWWICNVVRVFQLCCIMDVSCNDGRAWFSESRRATTVMYTSVLIVANEFMN